MRGADPYIRAADNNAHAHFDSGGPGQRAVSDLRASARIEARSLARIVYVRALRGVFGLQRRHAVGATVHPDEAAEFGVRTGAGSRRGDPAIHDGVADAQSRAHDNPRQRREQDNEREDDERQEPAPRRSALRPRD
jgi:hypothetical protein